jgi:hypothetical protein
MAHFALVDDNNTVTTVLVVGNEVTTNDEGVEKEQLGIDFLKDLLPDREGTWVQTSYWGSIRNKFAAIGDTYDEALEAFVPLQPYPSWVTLNTSVSPFQWEAPVERPDSGHNWDEDTQTWIQPEQPFPSWIWSDDGWWLPPITYPGEGPRTAPFYDWNEETQAWDEIE